MRIGVFADVHGNIYAFEKVFASLKQEGADLYVFCGDICGYYYYQNEVVEILQSMNRLVCVAGNHDRMFLRTLQDDDFSREYEKKYGRSCSLLAENITEKNLEFIKDMPDKHVFDDYSMAVFHGSPWDNLNEYVYPDSPLGKFIELPYSYILLGHTHYPMDRSVGRVRVVNPGSCGQPRDYRDCSYAIVDIKRQEVEFRRVQYNVDSLIKDVQRNKEENSHLTEVLEREKIDFE